MTKEQLKPFIPSYRAGWLSAGGRDEDLKDENEIVQKMESAHVLNESQAEKAGREDGFEWRRTH